VASLLHGATEVVLAGHATGLKSDARRVLQVPTHTLSRSISHSNNRSHLQPRCLSRSTRLARSLCCAPLSLSGIWSASTRRWRRRWWASSPWTSIPPKISCWRPRAVTSSNCTQKSEVLASSRPSAMSRLGSISLSHSRDTASAVDRTKVEGWRNPNCMISVRCLGRAAHVTWPADTS
jgi:hypothetical protein